MIDVNELRELAQRVAGWSNCNAAWLDSSEDVPAAVVGHIDNEGNEPPPARPDRFLRSCSTDPCTHRPHPYRNHLELTMQTINKSALPTIGIALAGGFYAGLILGKDGEADYHLILLPGEAIDVNWQDAKAWAEEQGGELPTSREQSLLFANAKEHFKPRWYWSGEERKERKDHAHSAWVQYFGSGDQDDDRKDYERCARAVRRIPANQTTEPKMSKPLREFDLAEAIAAADQQEGMTLAVGDDTAAQLGQLIAEGYRNRGKIV